MLFSKKIKVNSIADFGWKSRMVDIVVVMDRKDKGSP